ncbi:MAG: cytochrome c [Pirellulaceae bacterium]|nr:cytochrome c [Pirellulaceae bacterium]
MRTIRPIHTRTLTAVMPLLLLVVGTFALAQNSQSSRRRPVRIEAPSFEPGQFEGIFFADPSAQLQGAPPAAGAVSPAQSTAGGPAALSDGSDVSQSSAADPHGWHHWISATSLEDLIKASKLRLDKIVTTTTAFKGGGFVQARTEFSLQALLFAIIETYPSDVRWKNSAAEARQRMTRVAANTKIGSDQVFTEAKARLLDLDDLLRGATLPGRREETPEIDWSHLIDRVPLMQLLEWAQEENLNKLVASEGQFKDSSEEVKRYAELIGVLGRVALVEEMPDASDDDYVTLARAMTNAAQQVALAAQTGNAELARTAAGQIGQSCTNCHDSFR